MSFAIASVNFPPGVSVKSGEFLSAANAYTILLIRRTCGCSPVVRQSQFVHEHDLGLSYRARSCLRKMQMLLAPIKVGALRNSNGFTDCLDGVALCEQFANLLS